MRFQLPQLPYDMHALEPYISAQTLELHYGRHHKNYIDKTNQLLEAPTAWQDELTLEEVVQTSSGPLFNNASQAWNHCFFWHCLRPAGGAGPNKDLMSAINQAFGSFERFKQDFTEEANELFGSGYVWLIKDRNDELSIVTTSNADSPVVEDEIPLLTLDVWEHAYYVDYQNVRAKFVEGFWEVVNWDFVAENFKGDTIPNMTRLMATNLRKEGPSSERPQPSH